MNGSRTTTEQIDAILRRLDVASAPDPAFLASSHSELASRVRAVRARDASWFGRLRRELGLTVTPTGMNRSAARSLRLIGLVALLVLALVVALVIAGALNRPTIGGNGVLIVSVKGQLEAVDPLTGSGRSILPAGVRAEGVTRSPDGRLATYWVNGGSQSHLFAVAVDGSDRRELASGMSMTCCSSTDNWSSDSRFLASEVTLDGVARIIVVDVASGLARSVTAPGVVAHSPLWSPDDEWIAFTMETRAGLGLSIIRPDGTGMHDIGGNLHGLDVAGPDSWSPDGEWIYFAAGDAAVSHVFRANVPGRFSQQLTLTGLNAYATASSPDGTHIAFMVNAAYGFDLWIANSDGTGAHRILGAAGLGGWSADGQFILVRWKPPDNTLGGLGTVRPDGTDLKILIPYDPSCRDRWDQTCELGYGWGQARP
jgi:Tol biopolymer transport system component